MVAAQEVQRRTFHTLRVEKIITETADAKSIVFAIPEHLADVFRYEAGQFLTLEVPAGDGALKRCYSLASSPHVDREHKVTVKRVVGGRISNWVNDALREGDTVAVHPPEGRFVLTRGDGPLVLFGGGSGITPIISLLKSALRTSSRKITLVYANRDADSIIFKGELDALAREHAGRLEVVHRLDAVHGFVDDAFATRFVAATGAPAEYYMCGPGPFMDTVERALRAAGVDGGRIHIERFISAPDPEKTAHAFDGMSRGEVPGTVEVTIKGKRHLVPYVEGQSVLKAVLDAGLDPPFSCEEGFCGCCVALLTEGELNVASDEALTADEKKKGYVLTCQSRPKTRTCKLTYIDI